MDPAFCAMLLGTRKIPVPIIVPTTIEAAAHAPRPRTSSRRVSTPGAAAAAVLAFPPVPLFPRLFLAALIPQVLSAWRSSADYPAGSRANPQQTSARFLPAHTTSRPAECNARPRESPRDRRS